MIRKNLELRHKGYVLFTYVDYPKYKLSDGFESNQDTEDSICIPNRRCKCQS